MSEPAEPIAQEKPKAAGSGGFFISRRTAVLLACTYLVLIGAVAYVLLQNTHLESSLDSGFDLLSARVAWLGANQFVQAQKAMIITYAPMKQALLNYRTANGIADRYSIYYEDLTTGASVGIDEKNTFVPASLLKMPTVVAILKKVEIGSLSLDDTVTLAPDMIDTESGDLAGMGAGYVITVRQLLNYTTAKSDNTALWALDSLLTIQEYTDARAAIGLPYTSRMNDTIVSPKAYSNILRALYLSTYLHRSFSQLALSMMSETDYTNQLQAGIPADIKVAHKIGFYATGGYYHDCGIVYVPDKPYIVCVMSRDSTPQEANVAISGISGIVYRYVTTGSAA